MGTNSTDLIIFIALVISEESGVSQEHGPHDEGIVQPVRHTLLQQRGSTIIPLSIVL
jgi:hypothetical protein